MTAESSGWVLGHARYQAISYPCCTVLQNYTPPFLLVVRSYIYSTLSGLSPSTHTHTHTHTPSERWWADLDWEAQLLLSVLHGPRGPAHPCQPLPAPWDVWVPHNSPDQGTYWGTTMSLSHSACLLITLASFPFCSSLWPQSHSAHYSGLIPILLITLASIPFCSSLWPHSHSAHYSGLNPILLITLASFPFHSPISILALSLFYIVMLLYSNFG